MPTKKTVITWEMLELPPCKEDPGFSKFVLDIYELLVVKARKYTNDNEQADYITNVAIAKIFGKFELVAKAENLPGYCYGILRNTAFDEYRIEQRQKAKKAKGKIESRFINAAVLYEHARRDGLDDEQLRTLKIALNYLAKKSPYRASVISMFYLDGLDPEKIAEILGTTRAGVMRAKQRGLTDARNHIAKETANNTQKKSV
jgi:RNA polymerase sigma factor (sigma-70 family)